MDYNQAAASQEYDKSYGRALGEYQMGYGQDATADQQRWARESQKFGMNRQAGLDQYDRDFQRHQANQAGQAGAYGQRMQAHQMGTAGGFQASQSNRANELAARQSNLMKYGQNLAGSQGEWDRGYMGMKDLYNYQLGRAGTLDAQAASSAARAAGDSNRRYARGYGEYRDRVGDDRYERETRWKREGDVANTPDTEREPTDPNE